MTDVPIDIDLEEIKSKDAYDIQAVKKYLKSFNLNLF